ncbi:hypothetical protein P170DRAFT_437264 [Aspergillus steynii IBT 23096]|uniref:BZIP domain-containing protein n=1 Tax=Aspergillus steynii IBT 23096 TaxID=1392250 RepID=A0A2I2GA54_9EURO|nr:uncharacterized protein P170DRAFT_437264 [Aspergillus steynii IBT 23096]PLB49748.1 hypothetical protein P170DRAFT_437264 [Aspergillus steynii IBT 23096]
MSAQITHPPSANLAFPDPATSAFALPNVPLTPGFFSLPSLANTVDWPLSDTLPTPPPIPSWAIKPDPDGLNPPSQQQKSLCIDPSLQPSSKPSPSTTASTKPPRSASSSTPTSSSASSQTPPSQSKSQISKDRLKRENFLARNRMAASKCRQKKKKHNKALENEYERVAREKKLLQTEADYLRAQVLQLKDELLRHSQCEDASIKGHLNKMVTQVAMTRKSDTFIDINSLLTTSEEEGSVDADSPLLQEVMEPERRDLYRMGEGEVDAAGPGVGVRTGDNFDDFVDFG